MAIRVEDLCLSFGIGKKKISVLKHVNINVGVGSIYGLLGPSGSGKTSLLSCITGVTRPDTGQVFVFDRAPHTPGLGVPGPTIGYMPQSHSLHSYFTALEILDYYGRLFGVDVKASSRHLLETLDLLNGSVEYRQLTSLSGGQRRRVSLACALIHNPQILILDEPTVGVDPVLRQTIWRLLVSQARQGTTVIVTTHYIEEVSLASKVAFLRKGTVLEEGSPESLKNHYKEISLEAIFLKLCLVDEGISEHPSMKDIVGSADLSFQNECAPSEDDMSPLIHHHSNFSLENHSSKWNIFSALVAKNLKVLRRHRVFMAFQTILPVVTLLMFFYCIGQPIKGLTLAVANEDSDCVFQKVEQNITCPSFDFGFVMEAKDVVSENVSCQILQSLNMNVFTRILTFSNKSIAEKSVIQGSSHAYIHFEDGFAKSLSKALLASTTTFDVAEADVNSSLVKVHVDETNIEIARTVKIKVFEAVQGFFLRMAEACNAPEHMADALNSLGITIESVRGSIVINLGKSMLPAMMSLLLHLLAMALTADVFMTEKEAGILTRDFICGVSLILMLLAQMIVTLIVVVVQILFCLLLLILVFPGLPVTIVFSLGLFFLLQSICGMSLGLFLSSLVHSRDQVIQMGVSYVFPAFLLSGVLWARMAMPTLLQGLSVILPSTIPSEIAKNVVMAHRVTVTEFLVCIALPLVWTCALLLLALFISKRHSYQK